MSRAREQFQAFNARTTARITVPPAKLARVMVPVMAWLALTIYLAAHHMISGLAVFGMMVAGLIAPSLWLRRQAKKMEKQKPDGEGSPFI